MNNLNREQFIFNFLEGNLSKSEHNLCIELMETDQAFKLEVERWKSSYYQRDITGPHLHDKEALIPQKSYTKLWLLGGLLVTLFISYTFIKQETRTDELENQVNELQDKINHSSEISTKKKVIPIQQKITNQVSKPQKKTRYDKKGATTPILKEKNEYYTLQKGYNSSVKTPDKMENSVTSKQEKLNTEQTAGINTILTNSIKDPINDSIAVATNKTEEAIDEGKIESENSNKKRKRLKDLFKDQRVTPME